MFADAPLKVTLVFLLSLAGFPESHAQDLPQLQSKVKIELGGSSFFRSLPDVVGYHGSARLIFNLTWGLGSNFSISEILSADSNFHDLFNAVGSWHNVSLFESKSGSPVVQNYQSGYQSTTRSKRSLSFVGDGLRWAFNLATLDDVNNAAKSNEHLDNYLSEIRTSLHDEHQSVVHVSENLKAFSFSMNRSLDLFSAKIKDLEFVAQKYVPAFLKVSRQLYVWHFETLHFLHYYHTVDRKNQILNSCAIRKLPQSAISNEILDSDLAALENSLFAHGKQLAIPRTNLAQYFSISTTECLYNSERIIISMSVPIIDVGQNFHLYAFTAVAFRFKDQLCFIKHDNEIIAHSGSAIRSIKGNDLAKCNVFDHENLCYVPNYNSDLLSDVSCASLAFNFTSIADLRANCEFKCDPLPNRTIVQQLDFNVFHLINPPTYLKFDCSNVTYRQNLPHDTSFGSVRVTLQCGCSIQLPNSVLVSPEFPCSGSSKVSEIVHLLPEVCSVYQSISVPPQHADFGFSKLCFDNLHEILDTNWSVQVPILNTNISDFKLSVWHPSVYIPSSISSFSTLLVLVLLFIIYRLDRKIHGLELRVTEMQAKHGDKSINISASFGVDPNGPPPLPKRVNI